MSNTCGGTILESPWLNFTHTDAANIRFSYAKDGGFLQGYLQAQNGSKTPVLNNSQSHLTVVETAIYTSVSKVPCEFGILCYYNVK